MSNDLYHTKILFLRCMCSIYLAAFFSLYLQIPGLYGENGILPAHLQVKSSTSFKECIASKKTLLCLSSTLGLNASYMMELIALCGAFLSFIGLIWKKCCTALLFTALWGFYLSLYQVGQTFLWFQWDILLLETGFLTIFVAPLIRSSWSEFNPRNLVTMWSIRWLLFRLMFASGVVKLQSGCPTWWGLSALNVHYESQCIPTFWAWFAHHFPTWFHKLCVVATYVIEIGVPFLFFSPIRSHRIFSFYSQVLLQVAIILTGNYNFFNLLTLTLCLSLLDDVHLGFRYVKDYSTGMIEYSKKIVNSLAKWIGYLVLIYYSFAYFSIRISPNGGIDSDITFTRQQFDHWVSKAYPLTTVMAAASLLITMAESLTCCLFEMRGFFKKISSFSTTLAYSMVIMILFGISLVPYSSLHPPSREKIYPAFKQWHSQIQDLQLSSSYGLFRHMTGVGGRPEVILEGSNSREGPWIEYEFPYKPGSLSRPPPFIIPHQPRVDWQMWFAALGSYRENPWLLSMSYHLLKKEKSVCNFLDRNSPWREKAPKFIRARKYLYQYTSFNGTSGNWWSRKEVGEYMPVFSADHGPLLDALRKQQLIDRKDVPIKTKFLKNILDAIRDIFNILENHLTIWSVYVAAFIIILTSPFLS